MALGGHLPGEQPAPDASSVAAEGSFYSPIAGSRETRFSARPVFYGMKLAGLQGGKMRAINPKALPVGATAWAADMPTGETRVIVLNKSPRDKLDVAISSKGEARVWRLEAPSLTATSGVTLAGAVIQPGEAWKPVREERIVSRAGWANVTVPAASGAALFFSSRIN
jgi:hypothetical protein